MMLFKKYKKIPYCCIISVFFFLFLFNKANAANGDLIWNYNTRGFTPNDNVVDSSGVYTVGQAYCTSCFDTYGVVMKNSLASGNIQWSKDFIIFEDGYDHGTANAVAIDSTGLYVVGTLGASMRWEIRKYSLDDGSVIWRNNDLDLTGIARGVAVDSSGVYIVGSKEPNDWRVEKRNLSNGDLLWEQTSNIASNISSAYDIVVDPSGIYVLGSFQISGDDYGILLEKRSLDEGTIIWEKTENPTVIRDMSQGIAIDSSGLYVANWYEHTEPTKNKWRLKKISLSTGNVIWEKMEIKTAINLIPQLRRSISVDDNNVYVISYAENLNIDYWKLEVRDINNGGLIWSKDISPTSFRDEAQVIKVYSGDVYIAGNTEVGSAANPARIEKRCITTCSDFNLNPTPLRHATNPSWSEDYSVSITRQGGFNDAVTLSSLVATGGADLNITWPDGKIIPVGETGPKTMRVQAKDPPTESRRGTNYDITVTGTGGGITKNQDVDFYINKRPIAKFNVLGSTTINQGDYFRIRDNGSYDPDWFAPGNTLQIFAADFDGDGAVDKCFSLIAIPGCSNNPSDDPRTNIWQFQYNIPGNYTLTYAVLDDLFNDGPAPFSWTEVLKSAGFTTLGVTVKSVSPGNPPSAAIEIQDAGGLSIDNALVGESIYAYVGNSTDTDGNISLVSFCVDTTPEIGGAPKNCDGSITPWIIPPFGWNVSDSIRGWSSINKKWKTQMDTSGTYAIYAAVQDNDGIISEMVMDTITINAITVSTLKVCVEKCDSGGTNLLGSTLMMNKNSTVKLRACYNTATIDGVNDCSDASGNVTAPPTIWNDTDSPKNSVNLSFNELDKDEEVKSGGNTGDEDVEVTYNGNPPQTFTVNVQGSSVCGNGIKEGLEKCDDGLVNNGSCPKTCSSICAINNCVGNWREVPPQ